ncbi:MAG TPA: hypothetical protein VLA52_03635 [Thermohalobaculum sp.]|nr:hypothetical protein [Thermohalobaculum sp.]
MLVSAFGVARKIRATIVQFLPETVTDISSISAQGDLCAAGGIFPKKSSQCKSTPPDQSFFGDFIDILLWLPRGRNKITIDFALRRKIAYRLCRSRQSNHVRDKMGAAQGIADPRGGGDRDRTDAFRFAAGSGVYAFAAMGALGAFAVAAAMFDLGGAQTKGDALWLAPAGLFLILVTFGLFWLTRRRPVLLTIGPEGLNLPAALARPLAWAEIWRMRRSRRKVMLQPEFIMLKVELGPGIRPSYKRFPWTWPLVDAWLARKYGLRVPLHNLDAAEDVILASIERFKPVQRVAT